MEVTKNISLMTETPARKMTKDAMQADYEYRMAQRFIKKLLDDGLISLCEYDKISALNREKFCPFMAELIT